LYAGPESSEAKLLAGEQLPLLKKYCPELKNKCLKALSAVLDEELVPKDAPGLLSKMTNMPKYVAHWRLSGARARINRVLSLVKAHHPDVDLATVTSGLPELKADGTVLENKEFHDISKSLRGLTTTIASKLKLDKFFHAFDAENKPINVTTPTNGEKAPSVATPNIAEASRSKSPVNP
jgi:hypothetical protein